MHIICKIPCFLHNAVGFYLHHAYKTLNKSKGADVMMYQKIIVPVDHGNRNMKTEHKVFTSGFVEGVCRPALGEYLHYDGRC